VGLQQRELKGGHPVFSGATGTVKERTEDVLLGRLRDQGRNRNAANLGRHACLTEQAASRATEKKKVESGKRNRRRTSHPEDAGNCDWEVAVGL